MTRPHLWCDIPKVHPKPVEIHNRPDLRQILDQTFT
jgi:hypothetical protein